MKKRAETWQGNLSGGRREQDIQIHKKEPWLEKTRARGERAQQKTHRWLHKNIQERKDEKVQAWKEQSLRKKTGATNEALHIN